VKFTVNQEVVLLTTHISNPVNSVSEARLLLKYSINYRLFMESESSVLCVFP